MAESPVTPPKGYDATKGPYRHTKPNRLQIIQQLREMRVNSCTTDEIQAAFSMIPKRTLFRYLDLAFVPEAEIMLSPQRSAMEFAQAITVYKDQLRRTSRKLDALIDNESLPAKNRVEAASLKAQLDLAVAKATQESHAALMTRSGTAQLINEIENILKNPFGYNNNNATSSATVKKEEVLTA